MLFSQDSDLLDIAQRRQQEGLPFTGLVYGRQLHLTIGQAVRNLKLIAGAMGEDEMRYCVLYIPLR